MDIEIDTLQSQLNAADYDKRVRALQQLKTVLERGDHLPATTTHWLTESLKLNLRAPNAQVSFAALSCLPAFLAQLVPAAAAASDGSPAPSSPTQAAHNLKHALVALLPLDKLVDSKERVRDAAREATVSAARAALRLGVHAGSTISSGSANGQASKDGPWPYLEDKVREMAFHSKSPKAREQALQYLLALRVPSLEHKDTPLPPLRPFTPLLLPLLSDPDQHVRSLALSTTIVVFSAPSVTPAAKGDLKKEMIKLDVNKKVQEAVLAAVLGGGPASSSTAASAATSPGPQADTVSVSDDGQQEPPRARRRPPSPETLAANLPASAFPSDPSAVHTPAVSAADIPPVYIATARDLHAEFQPMKAGFEGRETEHNWVMRDRSVTRLRGMVKADVKGRCGDEFLTELKGVVEGVLKTASSLRTTLAVSALSLIAELAVAFESALDAHHLYEQFLSHCLFMAGQTKKIVASASQSTVETLLRHHAAHYHHRTLNLLALGMSEKTVQARQYVSSHVLVFIEVHHANPRHVQLIETTGGFDDLETCIKKGVADANAVVKDNSRKALWAVRDNISVALADRITQGLDATSRKQLEKADPRRHAPLNGGQAKAETAAKVAASSAGPTKKPSVREMMLQKKREAAAAAAAGGSPRQEEAVSPTPTSPSPSTPTLSRRTSHIPAPNSPPSSHARGASHHPHPTPLSHAASPRSKSNGHVHQSSIELPVTERIVDDALQAQAQQAEQAAERLLELNDEDSGASAAVPAALAMKTPVSHRVAGLSGGEGSAGRIFEDSPDPRNVDAASGEGKGERNWWMMKKRPTTRAQSLAPVTPERTQQIASLVSALQSGQIDAAGLQQLSELSRERPAYDDDDEEEDTAEAEEEEAGDELESPSRPAAGYTSARNDRRRTARSFWHEGKKFERIFAGLESVLLDERDLDRQDAALALLKDLVENQSACFTGDEAAVFSLLFRMRESNSRSVTAAVEGIADAYIARSEPLYSLGSLCSSLTSYMDRPQAEQKDVARCFALGLRLIGKCFERLPAEVLEDEVPRRAELIKKGLNDAKSADVRRAAVNALVSAQSVLRDEQRLYNLVGGLQTDQLNLLSYYISRRAA